MVPQPPNCVSVICILSLKDGFPSSMSFRWYRTWSVPGWHRKQNRTWSACYFLGQTARWEQHAFQSVLLASPPALKKGGWLLPQLRTY